MYLLELNPILAVTAIFPAVFLLVKIYKSDKLEKEPIGLLVSLVFLGIISTLAAIVLETVGMSILGSFIGEGTLLYNLILYFVVVAFSEEFSKYFLLKKRTWKSPQFNCRYDGVVYATFVSLGFALWENIGYAAQNGLFTALLRAVTAVPGHACFGVFMGMWYGTAKMYENMGDLLRSKRCRKRAVMYAVFMHGCYDFLTTLSNGFSLIWIAFVVIMFIIAWRTIRKTSENDTYIDRA